MAGLADDAWAPLRAQALFGFTLHSDGRLYHSGIVERAITALAEIEKIEKRKSDDRRRQKKSYERKKLAQQNGNGTPELTETSCGVENRHHDAVSAAPAPSLPPMVTPPAPSSELAISCGDPAPDAKSHTGNGQAAPTSSPHEAMSKIEPTTKPTILEWNTHVKNYRIHGHWSWRELGPSPRSPRCRVPSFVLSRHGYEPQGT
jgi:hypothetical protein